jgi:hypothetical protein
VSIEPAFLQEPQDMREPATRTDGQAAGEHGRLTRARSPTLHQYQRSLGQLTDDLAELVFLERPKRFGPHVAARGQR